MPHVMLTLCAVNQQKSHKKVRDDLNIQSSISCLCWLIILDYSFLEWSMRHGMYVGRFETDQAIYWPPWWLHGYNQSHATHGWMQDALLSCLWCHEMQWGESNGTPLVFTSCCCVDASLVVRWYLIVFCWYTIAKFITMPWCNIKWYPLWHYFLPFLLFLPFLPFLPSAATAIARSFFLIGHAQLYTISSRHDRASFAEQQHFTQSTKRTTTKEEESSRTKKETEDLSQRAQHQRTVYTTIIPRGLILLFESLKTFICNSAEWSYQRWVWLDWIVDMQCHVYKLNCAHNIVSFHLSTCTRTRTVDLCRTVVILYVLYVSSYCQSRNQNSPPCPSVCPSVCLPVCLLTLRLHFQPFKK